MSTLAAPPALSRPLITYTIPERFRQFPTDPTSVALRPLTVREELEAGKSALASSNPDGALSIELLRQSVFSVNGKQVDWGTADPQWLEATSPRCREILLKAFLRVNRVTESKEDQAAEAAFFASEAAVPG